MDVGFNNVFAVMLESVMQFHSCLQKVKAPREQPKEEEKEEEEEEENSDDDLKSQNLDTEDVIYQVIPRQAEGGTYTWVSIHKASSQVTYRIGQTR